MNDSGKARRLGIGEVCARCGVVSKTIDRWVKVGRFPAPHYLGRLRRWWAAEVHAWEAAEVAKGRPPRQPWLRSGVKSTDGERHAALGHSPVVK